MLSRQHAGFGSGSKGGIITEFCIMASAVSVAGGECLQLGISGFISLEHLTSCDPFFINHFPQGCPYSNKPLSHILSDNFCVIIYPKGYLLLLLMKLSLLPSLCSPSAFSHNYEDIRISIHSLKEIEWGYTFQQGKERVGDGPQTKQGLFRNFLLGNKRLQKFV